ncbi:hybrid sensor histidine kinase/response regulator [Paraliomyxa miuraensis]|uniref:hybrid sensor histidine kinase/response regulator n=1 Tax=Paraliomyxa miuraensis TaxID=376150 RepID=UPI002257099A|nr:hybrid sensor histidine kinase/response regulator [Paraliomyxa miuraensis]MCX4247835.1 AAA family ATPase [Paraliomyxa miuraensis]
MDHYLLGDPISVTHHSVLRRAVRTADGLPVIIKTAAAPHPSQAQLERLRREYQRLQMLDSPHVVSPIECIDDSDGVFIVFEDRNYESLASGHTGQMSLDAFFGYAAQLAKALDDIHDVGITHRDIKPNNVLVNEAGDLEIIDFGSASLRVRERQSSGASGTLEGSLPYIAPEQTRRMNRVVDYRCDFYSLGVMFYELLTGQLPFVAHDLLGWIHCHIAELPVAPTELRPDLPRPVQAIVLKLMAKLAEDRYQSARGLSHDIERCRREWQEHGRIAPFVLGEHDHSLRFELPQTLYGRDDERERLLQDFAGVRRTGAPHLSMVSGYSGIGKSALVNELHRPIVVARGRFISGKFDQFQRDVPYATFCHALESLVQQILGESPESLARWRRRLRQAVGDNGRVITQVIPSVELVIGEQAPVPELPSNEARNRFQRVFGEFLAALCSAEHPLAIFLDDLQWADQGSIDLIRYLFTTSSIQYFHLIGSYRDNEVTSSHPLMLVLDELAQRKGVSSTITLEPLTLSHMQRMLADAMATREEDVTSLARLVHEKTGGNPFFIGQLLYSMYDDGYIRRGPDAWEWNEDEIRQRNYSDNVVELMLAKLTTSSTRAVESMKAAACLGSVFHVRDLEIATGASAAELTEALEEVYAHGYLIDAGDRVQIAHDRIQQAAYALFEPAERAAAHLAMGRGFVRELSEEQLTERLFDVAAQFAQAVELLTDATERDAVARMFLRAGLRAKASAAYDTAIRFLTLAKELLPEACWERDYALAYAVHVDLAEVFAISSHEGHAEADRLFDVALEHSRTNIDRGAIYRIKVELATVRSDIESAVPLALAGLRLFGIDIPAQPDDDAMQREYDLVWQNLDGRSIESLVELPLVDDPEHLTCMYLLAVLQIPALFAGGNLLGVVSYRMVNLSLRHGNCPAAVNGYGWFGLFLQAYHRYRDGTRFSRLAYDLVHEHGFDRFEHYGSYFMELSSYWTGSISDMIAFARECYFHALRNGDVGFACYGCNHTVTNLLARGDALSDVDAQADQWIDYPRRTGFQDVVCVIRSTQQFVRSLRGLTDELVSWNQADFDLEQYEAEFLPPRVTTAICWHHVLRMTTLYHAGEYEQALAASERARELLFSSAFHPQYHDYFQFRSLCLAACYRDASDELRAAYAEEMQTNLELMERWTDCNPRNFEAKTRLVQAEWCRARGRLDEAMLRYDQAIASAKRYRFIHTEALALEHAGLAHREHGLDEVGKLLLAQAMLRYRAWGAEGKVDDLVSRFPHVRVLEAGSSWSDSQRTPRSGSITLDHGSAAGGVSNVDSMSLAKAVQKVSAELDLDRLLEALLGVAMENAGANVGRLLLVEDDRYEVAASAWLRNGELVVEKGNDSGNGRPLPEDTVYKCWRTRKPVFVEDAGADIPDAVEGRHERTRSSACIPLRRHGRVVGMFYLENTVIGVAYTNSQVHLLDLIASQAAISLSNALLYRDLRRENQERLEAERELREAKSRAEAANRAKSAFLAMMSHELRTPLNPIIGFTSLMVNEITNQEHLDYLHTMTHSANHLLELLSDILEYSKFEASTMGLAPRQFSMGKLIFDCVAQVAPGAEQKQLTLRVVADEAVLARRFVGDAKRLRQMVLNLLDNAVKYTKVGGITLDASVEERNAETAEVSIIVEDTGIGIAEDQQASIFEPFFQCDSSSTRRHGGAGLGLAIAKQFALLLSGDLGVTSVPGKGSRFRLTVPLGRVGLLDGREEMPAPELAAAARDQATVLVVEDNDLNAQVITAIIKKLGHAVLRVSSGAEALRTLPTQSFDLVLLDLQMPGMDGYQTAVAMRKDTMHLDVPIVAVTAHASADARAKCLASGMNDFLTKPVSLSQMTATLGQWLDRPN